MAEGRISREESDVNTSRFLGTKVLDVSFSVNFTAQKSQHSDMINLAYLQDVREGFERERERKAIRGQCREIDTGPRREGNPTRR